MIDELLRTSRVDDSDHDAEGEKMAMSQLGAALTARTRRASIRGYRIDSCIIVPLISNNLLSLASSIQP